MKNPASSADETRTADKSERCYLLSNVKSSSVSGDRDTPQICLGLFYKNTNMLTKEELKEYREYVELSYT